MLMADKLVRHWTTFSRIGLRVYSSTQPDMSGIKTSDAVQPTLQSESELDLSPTRSIRRPRFHRPVTLPDQFVNNFIALVHENKLSFKALRKDSAQFAEVFSNSRLPAEAEVLREKIRYQTEKVRDEYLEKHPQVAEEPMEGDKVANLERKFWKTAEKRVQHLITLHRPLLFKSIHSCLAYGFARAPADHACLMRALHEIRLHDPGFTPRNVLDLGSGLGTSYWACQQTWPDANTSEYLMIDRSNIMNNVADQLTKDPDNTGKRQMFYRVALVGDFAARFDVAVSAFTLLECASMHERLTLVENMWHKTNRYLVLVERASHNGFRALMEARDHLIHHSQIIDVKMCRRMFQSDDRLDPSLLTNNQTHTFPSDLDRLRHLQQQVPSDVLIPTELPQGDVIAPCPHREPCARMRPAKVTPCTTPVSYKLPQFITGRCTVHDTHFVYLVMKRRSAGEPYHDNTNTTRVISPVVVRNQGRLSCHVCIADGNCAKIKVRRSSDGAEIYGKLKKSKHGDSVNIRPDQFNDVNRFI